MRVKIAPVDARPYEAQVEGRWAIEDAFKSGWLWLRPRDPDTQELKPWQWINLAQVWAICPVAGTE